MVWHYFALESLRPFAFPRFNNLFSGGRINLSVMKRCLLMFGILIVVLLLAVFTKEKQSRDFVPNFAVGDTIGQNALLTQGMKDTIK